MSSPGGHRSPHHNKASPQHLRSPLSSISSGSNTTTPTHSAQPHNSGFTETHSPRGVRRSSATGITHQRPPIPPTIGARSHSLDGLLETGAITNSAGKTLVGVSSEKTTSTLQPPPPTIPECSVDSLAINSGGSHGTPTATAHRRSRSMDDLLDERDECKTDDDDDRSKSLENLVNDSSHLDGNEIGAVTKSDNHHRSSTDIGLSSTSIRDATDNIGSDLSLSMSDRNPTPSELPCGSETIIVEHTMPVDSGGGDGSASLTQSFDDGGGDMGGGGDDDTASANSTYSRQSSITSRDSETKKRNFLNRYVKKVKSFIKK